MIKDDPKINEKTYEMARFGDKKEIQNLETKFCKRSLKLFDTTRTLKDTLSLIKNP